MKRKTKNKRKSEKKRINNFGSAVLPIVKIFSTATILIIIVVMFPLSLVWKQVYITNTSLHQNSLQDSLTVLQKEVITLTMAVERLSSTERIEKIAKESLALDYPSSKEIVVIRPRKKKESGFKLNSPFWTVFKKSLTPEKG